jgi:hypothetical protein
VQRAVSERREKNKEGKEQRESEETREISDAEETRDRCFNLHVEFVHLVRDLSKLLLQGGDLLIQHVVMFVVKIGTVVELKPLLVLKFANDRPAMLQQTDLVAVGEPKMDGVDVDLVRFLSVLAFPDAARAVVEVGEHTFEVFFDRISDGIDVDLCSGGCEGNEGNEEGEKTRREKGAKT